VQLLTYYAPRGVSQVRDNNRKSADFVNAQFIAQKAGFSYDLRDFLREKRPHHFRRELSTPKMMRPLCCCRRIDNVSLFTHGK
jgi:hypothetical protein